MKGLFIKKSGRAEQAFEWGDLSIPKLEKDEVLIEVAAFGINYADIMARQGLYGEAPDLPFVPGYEVVGIVTDCGDLCNHLLGKRVVAFTRFGGYATHVKTKTNGIVEIGEELDIGDALALATQYVTAYYACFYIQTIRPKEKILIQASAGGVGIAINQLAKLEGATTIGLCGSPEKQIFCKGQGYDHVFNYREGDYLDQIKGIYPEGLDVCFNSLAGKSFKKEKSLLNHGGRIVIYGGASRSGMKGGLFASLKMVWQMGFIIPLGLMMGSRSILGVNMLKVADFHPEIIHFCINKVFELYQQKKIKPVVNHVFKAEDIASAHELIESRKSIGKVICTVKD